MTIRLAGSFPVGVEPSGVCLHGSSLYVTDLATSDIYAVSATTGTVVATISTGLAGHGNGICVTPDGSKVYAAVGAHLVVISTATDTVLTTLSGFSTPNQLAVTPDGTTVWLTDAGNHNVYAIATSSDTIIHTASTGGINQGVAADNTYAYAAVTSGTLYRIAGGSTSGAATIGSFANTVALSTDGTRAYVGYDDGVAVVNTATMTVVGRVTLTYNPLEVAATLDGKYLLVTDPGAGTLDVVMLASLTVTETLTPGNFPQYIALNRTRGYVPDATASAITVISLGAVPTRQYPRDDGLALGAVRQSIGSNPSSLQSSARQGTAGSYS